MAIQDYSGYKDLDLTFNIHPVKKDIITNTGELAVVKALKNLLLTNRYEKPFQPEYGSNIRKMLFEPLSPMIAAALRKEIEYAIRNFEPRVDIVKIDVEEIPSYNSYQVTIEFYIDNLTQPFTADFILSRLR